MSEVFRCDYCGTLNPLSDATILWVHDYDTTDDDAVYTSGIYCSQYCARQTGSRVGGR